MEDSAVIASCSTVNNIFPAFPVRKGLQFNCTGGGGHWLVCRNEDVVKEKDGRSKLPHQSAVVPSLIDVDSLSKAELFLTENFILNRHQALHPHEVFAMNISGKGLIGHKGSFENFVNLTKILADDNELNMDTFSSFPSVQHLDISSNSIRIVHGTHDEFHRLETLNLSFNLISLDSITKLGHLPSLKCLYLTGNSLQSLPNELSSGDKFTKLETLHLDRNRLKNENVFPILSSFPKLKHLNLSGNGLHAVPYLVMNRNEYTLEITAADKVKNTGNRKTPSDIETDVCNSYTSNSRSVISSDKHISHYSKETDPHVSCDTIIPPSSANDLQRVSATEPDNLQSVVSVGRKRNSTSEVGESFRADFEGCLRAGKGSTLTSEFPTNATPTSEFPTNKTLTSEFPTKATLTSELARGTSTSVGTSSADGVASGNTDTFIQNGSPLKFSDNLTVELKCNSELAANLEWNSDSLVDFTDNSDLVTDLLNNSATDVVDSSEAKLTGRSAGVEIDSSMNVATTLLPGLRDIAATNVENELATDTRGNSFQYSAATKEETAVSDFEAAPDIEVKRISLTNLTWCSHPKIRNQQDNDIKISHIVGSGSKYPEITQNNDSDVCKSIQIDSCKSSRHGRLNLNDAIQNVCIDTCESTVQREIFKTDDPKHATLIEQQNIKQRFTDTVKNDSASCYFVSHIPFPELVSLALSHTMVSSEEALLSLAGWPALKDIDIRGTPLVARHRDAPRLLTEYLERRCGIIIRRQDHCRTKMRRPSQIPKNLRKLTLRDACPDFEVSLKHTKNKNYDVMGPIPRLECQVRNLAPTEIEKGFTDSMSPRHNYPLSVNAGRKCRKGFPRKDIETSSSTSYDKTEDVVHRDATTVEDAHNTDSDTVEDIQYGSCNTYDDKEDVASYPFGSECSDTHKNIKCERFSRHAGSEQGKYNKNEDILQYNSDTCENPWYSGPDISENTEHGILLAYENVHRDSLSFLVPNVAISAETSQRKNTPPCSEQPPETASVSRRGSGFSASGDRVYLTEVNENVYQAKESGRCQSRFQSVNHSLSAKKACSLVYDANDPIQYTKNSIRANITALKHTLEHPVTFSNERYTIERLKKVYENQEQRKRTVCSIQRRPNNHREEEKGVHQPVYITNNITEMPLEDALRCPSKSKDHRNATRLVKRLQIQFRKMKVISRTDSPRRTMINPE